MTEQKCIAEKDKEIEDLIAQRDRAFLESRRIARQNGMLRDEINANKKAKSEAVKKFAEQVIKQSCLFYDGKQYISANSIRKLAKKW